MGINAKEAEKSEKIIRGLLKLSDNRKCINCNSLGPQYVCSSFNTFVCTSCSGIHREFSHRIKSVSMAKFSKEEAASLQLGGNEKARQTYFKTWDSSRQPLPDNSDVPRLREFIKLVYVERRFTGEAPAPAAAKQPAVTLKDTRNMVKSITSLKNGNSKDSREQSSDRSDATDRHRPNRPNNDSPQTRPITDILGKEVDRIVVLGYAEDTVSGSSRSAPRVVSPDIQRKLFPSQDVKGESATPESGRRPNALQEPASLIDFSIGSSPAPASDASSNQFADPFGLQELAAPSVPSTVALGAVTSWATFDPMPSAAGGHSNGATPWPPGPGPSVVDQWAPPVAATQGSKLDAVQSAVYPMQAHPVSHQTSQPVAPPQPQTWDAFSDSTAQTAPPLPASGPPSTGSSSSSALPPVNVNPSGSVPISAPGGTHPPSTNLNPSPWSNPPAAPPTVGVFPSGAGPASFGGPSSFGGGPTSPAAVAASPTSAGPSSNVKSSLPTATSEVVPPQHAGPAAPEGPPAGPQPADRLARREIPEDFFSDPNPYGPPSTMMYAQSAHYVAALPLGGYGAPNPPPNQQGYSQYTPLVTDVPGTIPAYAQPPKSLNPFDDDLSPTATASTPAFSMAPLQDALPRPMGPGPLSVPAPGGAQFSSWGSMTGPASYPPVGVPGSGQMGGFAPDSGGLPQLVTEVHGVGGYGYSAQYGGSTYMPTGTQYQGPGSTGAYQMAGNPGAVGYAPNSSGGVGYGPSTMGGGGYGPSSTDGAGYGPSSTGHGGYGPSSNGAGGYGNHGPNSAGRSSYGPSSVGATGYGPSSVGSAPGSHSGDSFGAAGNPFGKAAAATTVAPPPVDPFAGLGLPFTSSSNSTRNGLSSSNPFG